MPELKTNAGAPYLSVIVSVYNEEAALPSFYPEVTRVLKELGRSYELLFVNDGSADRSYGILNGFAARDPAVRVLHFSRNFGHEAAMIAGIDHAEGSCMICMDADLQHPPACIPGIIAAFESGNDVVSMVRTANKSAGLIKNITSSGFYFVMNRLSGTDFEANASDFFGLTRRAADVLRQDYRERVRFLRGFVQSIGFRRTVLSYEAADRVAGQSKYSIRKLFRFSMDIIMSFSDLPLKLGVYAGIFSGFLGLLLLVYTVVTKLLYDAPGGYPTIICVICFMFAVLFLIVGIIGQYIGILFREVKGRPIYIVAEEVSRDAGRGARGAGGEAHGA